MAVDWELYKKYLGLSDDETERDSNIADAIGGFVDGIVNDPAYQADATVNGENIPIVAERKSAMVCDIKAVPGSDVHIGDIVGVYDEDWIVVELYVDKVGIINGTIWMCNNIIKFQNHSHTVHTRLCCVDNGVYYMKSTDPKVYLLSNTYKLYLSLDEESKKLFVDKRLGLGKIYSAYGEEILEVYKICGIDIKSKNFGEGSHLMVLTLQRHVYNPETDSINDNLCDVFVDRSEEESEPTLEGSCYISGTEVIRIGVSRKYAPVFYEPNSSISNDPLPRWNIVAPDGITYSTVNGEVIINVPMKEKYIGSEVEINLSDEDGKYGSFCKKVQVV